jgi:hypothetical protein
MSCARTVLMAPTTKASAAAIAARRANVGIMGCLLVAGFIGEL